MQQEKEEEEQEEEEEEEEDLEAGLQMTAIWSCLY